MSTETFQPYIDDGTNTQTCVQKTSADTTANLRLSSRQFILKCHTYAVYIRLGPPAVEVTTANGYYMAAGDEIRWQTSLNASHLAVINATGGENGVISISPGTSD
ncbi:MAG: hypothetical protein GY861_14725 [bacterium]|nr:hypothetical protein [bacterium]